MKHVIQSKQQGVALILSLLILLVLTVLGVAAMNSTLMQERMAGNARTQAEVFETSSEGVTRALEFFYENGGDLGVLDDAENSYDLACGQLFGNYDSFDPDSAEAWAFPADGSWQLSSEAGDNPSLEQRMYCCETWTQSTDADGDPICVEKPSKLFALNRATFMGGTDNSESLALREIEVQLAESEPDDPTCAVCVPGEIGSVSGPNSDALSLDGACGAAVVTEPGQEGTFKSGIRDRVLGNFDGGVVGDQMGSPWNDPIALAEFVFWVKLGLPTGSSAADAGVGDSSVRGLYIDEDDFNGGNDAFGTEANPQITYIDGNASFGGNASGAGIMIVRGTLEWNGTPKFDGLLISLGGGFDVGGGGRGGNAAGSMVITSLESTNAKDLFDHQVLHYEVARPDPSTSSEQEVRMYNPADYAPSSDVRKAQGPSGFSGAGTDAVPARPLLVDNQTTPRELIHYNAGTPNDISDDRFFLASDGSEVVEAVSTDANSNFIFTDATGTPIAAVPRQTTPTRDAYGRLIPDFVLADNYPDDYGYNPNRWDPGNNLSWDPDVVGTQLRWGSSDFSWSGGGNQSFKYDCRELQQVKHELLCAQRRQELPDPETDPNHAFYEDPDAAYGDYCWHSVRGDEDGTEGGDDGKYFYESDSRPEDPRLPENQHAWHLWSPSCDCLGISVDSDMIITGWRENLGWRDAEAFQGCAALATKNDCD